MRINNKNLLLAICLVIIPALCFAAGETPVIPKPEADSTPLIVLVSFSTLLLFIIGVLANAQKQLSEICSEKIKKEKNSKTVKAILVLSAISFPFLQAIAGETAIKPADHAAPIINGISDNDFYAIMAIIVFEFLIIFALLYNIFVLQRLLGLKTIYPDIAPEVATAKQPERSWFWDTFNKAVPIEKEKDLLMDHEYDGIRELDNSLPPWWKYGFYITIVIGAIYFYYYTVSGIGQSSKEEYEAEMVKGEEETAAFLATAGNSVDEKTVTVLSDGASLAEGKDLYMKNCTPCHLADGGGIVGPNLTDDYWLHGGSIKDIFKTIKYGYMDKGMKSWKDDFSPKQIQELASYVKSLHGTKPANPKAPQGELYAEGGGVSKTITGLTDSTKIK